MGSEIITALISAMGGIAVGGISIYVSKSIVLYRIDQLEKKVEKHNNVVERTYCLERDVKTAWKTLDEVRENIKELEDKVR